MSTPINPLALMSTGLAIAAQIGEAYELYEASAETSLTVPPIRAFIGGDHIEIDIKITRLPPP